MRHWLRSAALALLMLTIPTLAVGAGEAVPWLTVAANGYAYPTFSRTGQARWYRVRLEKGADYAVYGYDRRDDGTPNASLTLYGPTGRQLLAIPRLHDLYPSNTVGREFRAPATGVYRLKVIGHPILRPQEIGVGVAFDCRRGPTTSCVSRLGRTVRGYFNFLDDRDWRRLAVKMGRTYTVTVTGGTYGAAVQVRDRDGEEVAYCRSNAEPNPCEATFRAGYGGDYFLELIYTNSYDESVGTYTVAVTSP